MLKNMKIRKSLLLGFGASLLIPTLFIIFSLFMMNSQRMSYHNLIHGEIRADEAITECRLYSNMAARVLRDMVLDTDTTLDAEREAKIENALSQLDAALTELTSIYPLSDGKDSEYAKEIRAWESTAESILVEARNGSHDRAVSMIVNECTPQLDTIANLSSEIMSNLYEAKENALDKQERNSLVTIVVVAVIMVIVIIVIMSMAIRIIRSITEPVEKVRVALVGFSEGKLDIPVDYESKSELGEMCDALRTSQHVLDSVIKDACRLLEEMGGGNFDVRTQAEKYYIGELSNMLKSIRVINRSLSDTLAQISLSGEQVSSGSDQVSTGAQALAQGATQQASAVEELSATIAEISSRSQSNAQSSEEAMSHSKNADLRVRESADYMEEMVKAMDKISSSSQEIGKIIATIENIAFQTNILALNAAVEAARAGSAGKGFAVVADEVRNLATKSDQAAKATKELIDNSITSVQDGSEIVKRVSESLNKTVEATNETMSSLQEITKAVEEEAEAIAQVTEGIDQISSVVQTNSATSEQSAAASEELSSQASLMKDLLSKFRLRSESGSSGYSAPSYSSGDSAADTSYDGGRSGGAFSKY